MKKHHLMLIAWCLLLLVAIVSTGAFLGSNFPSKAFYYLKKSEYKDEVFVVTRVS